MLIPRHIRFGFWITVFVLCLLAADQLLLRVPLRAPGLDIAQEFYLDFRGRLLGLKVAGDGIEQVIAAPAKSTPPVPQPVAEAEPRYLYADAAGDLHFATSLEEIPAAYRSQAQPLGGDGR